MIGFSKKFLLILLFTFCFSLGSFSLVKAEETTSRPADGNNRQVKCSRQYINGQFQCFGLCDNGGECKSLFVQGGCSCVSVEEYNPSCTCPAGKPTKIGGNANCDSAIDILDFQLWVEEYRQRRTTKTADFNCDNIINILDFQTWKNNRS